jgi:hypothetical protein
MALALARFSSLLFTALAMAPAVAHLLELPNKIGLSRDEYLTVQQIYRGWALLGVVVFGAWISTLTLAVLSRRRRSELKFALAAFLSIVGTQVVFWTFTYPMNARTMNWTVLPEGWEAMRLQWELSHAASAILNLVALVMTILCVLGAVRERRRMEGAPLEAAALEH